MMRRGGLRRKGRIRSQSRRRTALHAEYIAFVLGIKARDGWRCTYCRETAGPLDPHHTLKPRATYLTDPDSVVTLCRNCHNRCSGPFDQGRLIVTPIGGQKFHYRIVYAMSKAHALAAGAL